MKRSKKVITGESNKFLVIIGPCSADNEDAVCDYANRLAKVRKRQKTDFSLYQEFIPISQEPQAKAIWVCSISRTRKKKPDMLQGILAIRHMHMKVFRETGMSTADEMLYPDNLQYLSDIIVLYCSWRAFCREPVPPSGSQRL